MAAAETLTWDIVPARRPSLEDVGGAACLDDTSKPPPRDGTHLYANLVNQLQRQVQALAKMVPSARLTISSGLFVDNLITASGIPVIANFTVASGGAGIVNISWPAGLLPAVAGQPTVTPADSIAGQLTCQAVYTGATSLQVKTYAGGALASVGFVLSIH